MIIKNGRIQGQKGTIPYEAEDDEDMLQNLHSNQSVNLLMQDYCV